MIQVTKTIGDSIDYVIAAKNPKNYSQISENGFNIFNALKEHGVPEQRIGIFNTPEENAIFQKEAKEERERLAAAEKKKFLAQVRETAKRFNLI